MSTLKVNIIQTNTGSGVDIDSPLDSINVTNSATIGGNLQVNNILPSIGTNVAIGTAGGSVTLVGSVTGSSIINTGVTTVSAGSTSAPSISPTGDSNTGIFFPSADTIAFAEGGVESLRVDSSGNFGLGTKTPVSFSQQTHLTVNYSGSGTQVSGYNLSVNDTKYASIITYPSNTEGLRIATSTSLPLTFQVNNSEVGRFDTSGNLQVANGNLVFSTAGKGIDFSATANSSGTMTSELLSDYEQGTWTPSVGGNATYNFQGGSYVKVGSKVTAWFDISISTIGTGSQTSISGLPYSCANISSNTYPQGHPGCISYFTGLALNLTSINIRVDPGNSFFYVTGPTAATTTSGSTQNAMTSGTRIVGALIYVSA